MSKIAAITAAYKWKQFVPDYLESIRNQKCENLSVFVCDDASPDDSVDEFVGYLKGLKKFPSEKEPNVYQGTFNEIPITVIQLKQNRRQGFARNTAIRFATHADAYFIHDVDDYHYPNSISRHVEEWERDKENIGLVYSDYDIFDTRDGISIREFKQSFSYDELHKHCTSSSNCLISKEAMRRCGPYVERLSPTEDYRLSLGISNYFVQIHIPEMLWRYQVHGANSTIIDLERHKQMHYELAKDYQQWRNNVKN